MQGVARMVKLFRRMQHSPVHFLHIRKTGGTAIGETLSPIAQQFGIQLHPHSTKLCEIPRDDRVFFFVRHPVTRFTSGFFSRLRRGAPRHNYEWDEGEVIAFRHFSKPNDLAEALSATDSGIRQRAHEAMHSIRHVNSSYAYWFSGEQELRERLDSIILIGLQETMTQDFEELKFLLNLPSDLSLPNDEVLAHRTPSQFDRALTPLAEQNIRRWYAEDIRFYERCVRLRAQVRNLASVSV